MHNLRFLNLYSSSILRWVESNKVHVSQGLESIFNELRYLQWYGCPLKSLQSNIQPEKLVELEMPGSNVENLWSGVQELANLKKIDLTRSKRLTSLPDLSKAQNLERLELTFCESLLAIPDCSDLKSLTYLSLSYCLKLTKLPQLPHNLQRLYSRETPIEELPSSIEVLSRLAYLDLGHCSKLKCLPTSVCKWKSLQVLHLSFCSKLDKFWENNGSGYNRMHITSFIAQSDRIVSTKLRYHKDAFWKIQRLATSVMKRYIDKDVETIPRLFAELIYPGNEIPKWFDIQCTGSVIHAELQPDWFNHNFVCFALCAVVAFEDRPDADCYKDNIGIFCECFLESKDGNDSSVFELFSLGDVYINQPTHVFMGLDLTLYPRESLYYDNEVVFEFSLLENFDPIEDVKVEKCGVRLMYR
ncbi:hypothetical protein EZV62_003385 [Acer yangbiense]|uniref:C-JID domain-containing protein n=1 Tax=Acer yangbiense TaxID=1000413 RepID=A0A5C7IGJ6_9ROSI|nr:hypothetical protein EZV62_003385 [Acer yangbiense]